MAISSLEPHALWLRWLKLRCDSARPDEIFAPDIAERTARLGMSGDCCAVEATLRHD
jgi:hypothetical protein